VTSLTHQVDDGPVFLPLLEMIQGQCDGFVSSQPTRKQESQQSAVSFSLFPSADRDQALAKALALALPSASCRGERLTVISHSLAEEE
jgi:hypothetical protein